MYVVDFEFANKRLSDFGCVPCHINTDAGLQEIDIGCDITFNTVKNNHSSRHSVTSSSYDNVYSTTIEIAKSPCIYYGEDAYMTPDEVSALTKWLNRRSHHKFKLLNPNFPLPNVYYYGSFNVKEIILYDRVVGLKIVFTGNAPYGFDDPISFKTELSEANKTFSLYGIGDEIGIIYPSVSVKCLKKGELQITNTTTGTKVIIRNCYENETIYMDGEHKIITTDYEPHESTICNDFEYDYLDIEINDSAALENKYEVSIPCEISICYSPIRKVGAI